MNDALPGLTSLEGGLSGETFASEYAGERAVVRIYGRRSASRGPLAAEIDAAVLTLVRGLIPVPEVLEVRRGDLAAGIPALLVTTLLPGERLEVVLAGVDSAEQRAIGEQLGTLLARLGHMVQPRAGLFMGPELGVGPFPEGGEDLTSWIAAHHLPGFGPDELAGLEERALAAQVLLDQHDRVCLVHGDFNARNLLVDPATLAITGLVDWEFAHAGDPCADLGNLLRESSPPLVDGAVTAYRELMPDPPQPDLVSRAEAADLFAVVDLASRVGENQVADRTHAALLARLREGH